MYKPFAGGGGWEGLLHQSTEGSLSERAYDSFSKLISTHFLKEFVDGIWQRIRVFFYTWSFWTLITFSVDDVLTLLGENSVPRTVKPVVLYMFSTNVRHVWSTRVVRWLSSWRGSNDPWPFLILLQTVLTLKDHALHWAHLKDNKRNTYGNIYFQYVTF